MYNLITLVVYIALVNYIQGQEWEIQSVFTAISNAIQKTSVNKMKGEISV